MAVGSSEGSSGGQQTLRAGVAGVEITPDRPLPLEGYGGRTAPATGTLDPLEARAIVFDDGVRQIAILSVDVCGIEAASVARVRAAVTAACGLPPDHVMVTYSHTHAAPTVTPFGDVPVDSAYVRWLETALAEAVVTAHQRLQPVTLGTADGETDFNVNRRRRTPSGVVMLPNPGGIVDRRVRVLRVDATPAPEAPGTLGNRRLPQADPLAVLFAYTCHATVLGATNTRYSADYPGAARRFVERSYAPETPRGENGTTNASGTVGETSAHSGDRESDASSGSSASSSGMTGSTRAMFLPGCFGNVRPHLLRPEGSFRGAADHELTVLGRWLGAEVVRVAERIESQPERGIAASSGMARLAYSDMPDGAALRAALTGPKGWWAQAMLDRLERDGTLPDAEDAEVQVLRVGRHWLVGLPGETTLEIGLSIERGLVDLGLADPQRGDLTLVMGYTNGYVGYLCSASVISEGGYEPATSWPDYFRPGPFSAGVEPALVNTALGLAQTMRPHG